MSTPKVGSRPAGWSSDDWATPPEFVRDLEREFGPFHIDPCCKRRTAKAPRFFTLADNGLAQVWRGRVFLNPPYSKPLPWVKKAARVTASGQCPLVVALLPVNTDTRWFHDYVLPFAELRWLRGRIRFLGWEGTPIGSPRAGNMLAIYRAPAPRRRKA